MMLPTIQWNVPIPYTDCRVCGVSFASSVLTERLRDGKMFHCPNGHLQQFTESDAQKLAGLESRLASEKLARDAAETKARRLGFQIRRLAKKKR